MASATLYIYHGFMQNLMKKLIGDLSSESTIIKCALLDSDYTPSLATHTSYNDLTDELSTGSGYTSGGCILTNKTLSLVAGVLTFITDDATWPASTLEARYGVVYDDTTAGNTNKKLLLLADFGDDYTSSSSTFRIQWSASGLIRLVIP
jgi:hypothetical protein